MKVTKGSSGFETVAPRIVNPTYGNQIRSYVMQPYTMVKDLRTGEQTNDVRAVLDGDLDAFLLASLEQRVDQWGRGMKAPPEMATLD